MLKMLILISLVLTINSTFEKKHPIIISFTTIDSRINYIEPMICSILNQTLMPDKINLYISEDAGILNNGIKKEQLPDFIVDMVNEKKIDLIYTKDIGPHTKLIPCLKEYWNQDCIIITVDDDRIYPSNLIELMYKNYLEHDCIICCRANKMKFIGPNCSKIKNFLKWRKGNGKDLFNFAKGVDSVLYKPEFFTAEIFNIDAIKNCCPKADDIWFNFARLVKKIPVYKIKDKLSFTSVHIPNKIQLFSTNIIDNDYQLKKTFEYFTKNNLI
jgi:hypothetical protein